MIHRDIVRATTSGRRAASRMFAGAGGRDRPWQGCSRGRRFRLAWAALIPAAALAAGGQWGLAADAAMRAEETRRLMGVPWRIVVHAETTVAAEAALEAAFAEIARLERILSDYDADSELARLSARAPAPHPIPVGRELWQVLGRAVAIRDATDGAFDPAVGSLTTLWRQARRSGRLPRPDRLAAARATVGVEALRVAPDRAEVSLPRPGTRLDLGGIGMGHAADRALAVLAAEGITSALIDASGDIAVSASPPATTGWRIALPAAGDTPAPHVEMSRAAVTTSGDAHQAVVIDGIRYSHVVDPRTGLGVAGPIAVTVIAPDCTTADALATALCVLGPKRGLEVLTRFPGSAARFVWQDDGGPRELCSDGWPAPPPQPRQPLQSP